MHLYMIVYMGIYQISAAAEYGDVTYQTTSYYKFKHADCSKGNVWIVTGHVYT